MELSVPQSGASRPLELQPQNGAERPAVRGSVPEAARPETADAVRQPGATERAQGSQDGRRVGELTDDERRVVNELKARDREVRAHEQAHKQVGGRYAGAISYEYQRGPDGQDYAVGGSVPIDVSPEAEPEDTAEKMRVVIKAALAPAKPSSADRAVAAAAQAQLIEAQAQIAAERAAERRGESSDDSRSLGAAVYERAAAGETSPRISLSA